MDRNITHNIQQVLNEIISKYSLDYAIITTRIGVVVAETNRPATLLNNWLYRTLVADEQSAQSTYLSTIDQLQPRQFIQGEQTSYVITTETQHLIVLFGPRISDIHKSYDISLEIHQSTRPLHQLLSEIS